MANTRDNMASPTRRSKTLSYLMDKLESREDFGLAKYNKSIDREDYNFNDWSIHAEEELMDFLQYNARMRDLMLRRDTAVRKVLKELEQFSEKLDSHSQATLHQIRKEFTEQYHNRSTIQQGAMPHGTQDCSNSGQ